MFFFMAFDKIDAVFDLSVNVVIVGGIEVSPKNVFLVEHQLEELNQELILGCIDFADRHIYLLPSLGFILQVEQVLLEFFLKLLPALSCLRFETCHKVLLHDLEVLPELYSCLVAVRMEKPFYF
jgi:hypothetical protein